MSGSCAIVAIVGQGPGSGVKVRVQQVAGLYGDSGGVAGGHRPDAAETQLEQYWALAGDVYGASPAPHELVLKIARTVDDDGEEWIWVGLYRSANFSEDPRGGLYFGCGILFPGAPDATRAVTAVSKLFREAEIWLFGPGGVMTGSVDSLNAAGLQVPSVGPLTYLPASDGLSAQAREGVVIPDFDVTRDAAAALQDCLLGSRYSGYSTAYFCEDPLNGVDRRFPTKAAPQSVREERQAYHAPAAPEWPPSRSGSHAPTTVPGDDSAGRLVKIEQRLQTIERHLRFLADAQADPSPARTEPARRSLVRSAAMVVAALALLVGMYYGGSILWDRLFKSDQGPGAETSSKNESTSAEGPSVMVRDTTISVQPERSVGITARAEAVPAENATILVTVRDSNGQFLAAAYSAGARAEASTKLDKPGERHLIVECEAKRTALKGCSLATADDAPR